MNLKLNKLIYIGVIISLLVILIVDRHFALPLIVVEFYAIFNFIKINSLNSFYEFIPISTIIIGQIIFLTLGFKKGKKSIGISEWSIEKYATRNLSELRAELLNPEFEQKTIFDMEQLTKFGAFATITAGIFGMLFCLPFLFSSNMADLVGAGFPFIGGAILVAGGLLALSNLSRPNKSLQVN